MSLNTQAKVLRVLQEQVMEPVGGSSGIQVDARVLTATNKDLSVEIKSRRFREDLYFRLNVIPIFVPPLREREDDILIVAEYFMVALAKEYGRRRKTFDRDAKLMLRQWAWPGNVRELRNVVERLMIMVPGDRISSRELSFLDGRDDARGIKPKNLEAPTRSLHDARENFERDYILRALASQNGNMSRTAELLGVERSNLYRKIRGFGISTSRRVENDKSP
jgi:two-component system nitrogen regulation response regulator NtrX